MAEALRAATLLLLTALPAAIAVAQNDGDPVTLTGPVQVSADHAEWRNEGLMVYTGNVSLATEGMVLSGDRLALRQIREGRYRATITGQPAGLQHAARSADEAPVTARSRDILYDSGTGELELNGEVVLNRGSDQLTGDRIVYHLRDRRIEADGGNGSQVQITIQPPSAPPADEPTP